MKKLDLKPKLKLPRLDITKQSKGLVKTGVGVAVGLTLLGAGVKAFKDISGG